MKITKGDVLFSLSFILSIWFALTGMVWTYWIALIVSYPAGILSLSLWNKGRITDKKRKRYKIIPIILGIGLTLSLGALLFIK